MSERRKLDQSAVGLDRPRAGIVEGGREAIARVINAQVAGFKATYDALSPQDRALAPWEKIEKTLCENEILRRYMAANREAGLRLNLVRICRQNIANDVAVEFECVDGFIYIYPHKATSNEEQSTGRLFS